MSTLIGGVFVTTVTVTGGVTVAVTVLSGAEYFYRLRGVLSPQPAPSSHSRIET